MKKFGFLLMLLAACLSTSAAAALEVIAEARIESATGAPVQEEVRFRGQGYDGFVLKVENGAADGSSRVSSAVISLNGVKVLGPADFSQRFRSCSAPSLRMTRRTSSRSTCAANLGATCLSRYWANRFSISRPIRVRRATIRSQEWM